MSETGVKTHNAYVLPPSVVTKVDVARLVRDAERVDNELTTATVRAKAGSSEHVEPSLSESLASFLERNGLSFDNTNERSAIIKELRRLKDEAPIVHMTFATEADPESLAQLVNWFRESIHPQAVIAVGLQPALVAGVYLRTTNHVHDLSLRAKLLSSRDLLVKELEASRG
jgi:hypothetical protein